MTFDSIVIGKGLIGTAAAKYLSTFQDKIAVVGPDEPVDANDAVVFSSHYDQARIQRVIGIDPVWTLLNIQSTKAYPSLQKESNINFHNGSGCLYVNPGGIDAYLGQTNLQAQIFNLTYEDFENSQAIHQHFPDYNFPGSSKAILESSPSGYINPRLLIGAQLSLFKKNGGTIINDIAETINYKEDHIDVTTLTGETYKTKKILLSPGAFVNFFKLTERNLTITLKSETTLLAHVSAEEAKRLATLPSLLYEIDIPEYKNIYLIQPVQYPDGNHYLKMGCNMPGDIYFEGLQDIQEWFKNGDSDANSKTLQEALMQIMPGLKAQEFITRKCIVTFTSHHKPYIGPLNDKGLFVAAGGNGYSAMCSDALGSIAAHFLREGVIQPGYSAESFEPVFTD